MTAPAQFRRITPETEITVPCVLAVDGIEPEGWIAFVAHTEQSVILWMSDYTHWLPIQWPEVRG